MEHFNGFFTYGLRSFFQIQFCRDRNDKDIMSTAFSDCDESFINLFVGKSDFISNGNAINKFIAFISSREGFVPYAQLPQTYINAVISAEDSRFTHHKGVDPVSIARALVTDLRTGSFAEGGSTITQQLAKNTLFTQEKHLARKAAEMFAALAIEKQYNKEQIFEMYVNTIYFGSGHYGIGEAAQGYFGKTPLQLTDAEAVMLAGLPNAPSAYSPNSSPDLAVKRMQVVLNRMVGCKKLTREQADALAAEAVTLQFLPAS